MSAATSELLHAGPLLVMLPLEEEYFAIKASCNHPALIQDQLFARSLRKEPRTCISEQE